MYNIDIAPVFTRPVKLKIPDGTGVRDETFDATFRALDMDEVAKFDMNTKEGVNEFLKAAIVSFDKIVGNSGPVEYSADVRDREIGKQWSRTGLLRAYWEGVSGAEEGN